MFSPGSAPSVPSLSLTQPLPDRSSTTPTSATSASSPTSAAGADLDLPGLLAAHRQHVVDTTEHLGQLTAAMANANGGEAGSIPAAYCDGMIRVMSEQLMRTTRVLEMYVGVKKRILQENRSKRDEHDAFLNSYDNFR